MSKRIFSNRIQETEALLAAIVESSEDAIIGRDLNGIVTSWNAAAEKMYGYSAAEMIGAPLTRIIPPDRLEEERQNMTRIKQGEKVRHLETVRIAKDGREVCVSVTVSPIKDAAGHVIGASKIAIAIEVTAQRRAEEAIRQSEERLRALVTSMEDVALEFDREGTYIAIWTTRDELLSHPRSDLIGRTIRQVHGEAVSQRFVSAFRRVVESRAAETIDYTMNVLEGPREFVGRISPIVNPDGSCERFCILCRDVTEKKKLEAQFLRAQRMESIGTLASGVAHDLNNVLAPILMGAGVLRRTDLPVEDEKILSTIETCAQRGADIVKQVLTFARGAEGAHLRLQPAQLINEVAKIAGQTFPKTISVRTRFPEGLWPVEGDPTHLHQALLNLCVNARDAMPAGGTVSLSAENFPVDEHYASMIHGAKAGPYVLFEVTDTGMGIPRDIIDKIFEPFFTTKELGHGTGLGLSTVSGIVKSHGGFVSVYSEIGRGATFKLYLPAKMDALGIVASVNPALPRAEGELLLLVDDEKSILQVAKALLEDHGYRVLTAADAPQALAIFAMRKDEIKLVLTDLAMPLMDGIALIQTLQKMKADVRVIASTGRGGQEQHGQELESLKVRTCLTKPYNKTRLLTTLHDTLNQKGEQP